MTDTLSTPSDLAATGPAADRAPFDRAAIDRAEVDLDLRR